MSLLQDHLEELGSAIIDICGEKVKLTGFMSPERLLDYYDGGYDCRHLVGTYPMAPYDISYVKDNCLVLLLKNGVEQNRYHLIPIKKDTVKFQLPGQKVKREKVYTIRQCSVNNIYNYKDIEKSLLFNTKLGLYDYFFNEYGVSLIL